MKLLTTLLVIAGLFGVFQLKAAPTAHSGLQWHTNYEEAINLSKSTSKPVLLFFTGSDWCTWCQKLESEALDTPEFAKEAGDKFIFVKLDFPLNARSDASQTAQNKQLQRKYDIHGFPTIVILDGHRQQQIGVTGYRAGGGKQYANHLFKMVNDYSSYQSKLQSIDQKAISGIDLKQLYEKARELRQDNDANQIIKIGMKSDEEQFFLTERYRFLAEEGQSSDQEAVALKQRLLTSDPKNEHLTHYQIAIIDFESCCEMTDKEKFTADQAVAPLKTYIEKFGAEDKDNLWRLQIIISQVYFDHNNYENALKFAQESLNSAPSAVQAEIGLAVKNIQSKLASN